MFQVDTREQEQNCVHFFWSQPASKGIFAELTVKG